MAQFRAIFDEGLTSLQSETHATAADLRINTSAVSGEEILTAVVCGSGEPERRSLLSPASGQIDRQQGSARQRRWLTSSTMAVTISGARHASCASLPRRVLHRFAAPAMVAMG